MRWFVALALALLLPSAVQAQEQDLNCNGIPESEEVLVDLGEVHCQFHTDSDGVPWPNADYYVNYADFGCRFPVEPDMYDADGDSGVPSSGV